MAVPDGLTLPPDGGQWASLLYMALVAGALALWAQTWAQAHLTATRAAIVMALEPVFAAFFAVTLGGEGLTRRMLVGGALVVAAMYLVELRRHHATRRRRRPRSHPSRRSTTTSEPGSFGSVPWGSGRAIDRARAATLTWKRRPGGGRPVRVGGAMLGDHDTIATLAVKDLQVARDFYERVLGLTPRDDVPEGVLYTAGSGAFLVYPSSYAGTNRATAMSFQVPGDALRRRDRCAARPRRWSSRPSTLPASAGTTASHRSGDDFRGVWFEDPDGNILNVETGTT